MATRYNFFGGLVTDGMILDLDAAKLQSYPAGGTGWIDISGNRNNGVLTNGPTFSGISKSAYIGFDGADDYTAIPNFMGNSTRFSVSHFVYLNGTQNTRTIFSNYGQGNNGWVTGIRDDINNIFKFYLGNTVHLYANNAFQNSTWYHAAATYDNGSPKVYINGALNASSSSTLTLASSYYGNDVGRLGVGSQYFNGRIGNLQVYNRGLSAFEVWQNFNSYKSRYGIPDLITDGLVMNLDAGNPYSYYSPSSGTTWTDVSGNGNNGTLTNGVTYSNGTMVFDGVDDYATCGATAGNFGTSNFTINFFFKTSQAVAPRTFIAKSVGDNPTSNYGWLVNNGTDSSNLGFAIASVNGSWGNTGSYSIQTSGIAINDGNWKMATIVGDRTQANVTIYINGVSRSLQGYVGAASFSTVGSVSNNLQLTVGAESDPGPSLFPINGSISAVQIYNRALSSAEVLQNYNSLKGRYGL